MHAVRPGCQSNFDIIINHKRHMAEVAQGGQFLGFGQQVVFIQAFFPQLHKGCPAVNGLGHYIGKAVAVQPGAVGHSVQAQLLRQNFHKQNLQKRQNKKRARRKRRTRFVHECCILPTLALPTSGSSGRNRLFPLSHSGSP